MKKVFFIFKTHVDQKLIWFFSQYSVVTFFNNCNFRFVNKMFQTTFFGCRSPLFKHELFFLNIHTTGISFISSRLFNFSLSIIFMKEKRNCLVDLKIQFLSILYIFCRNLYILIISSDFYVWWYSVALDLLFFFFSFFFLFFSTISKIFNMRFSLTSAGL